MSHKGCPELVYHARNPDTCDLANPSPIATPRSDMELLWIDD